MYEIVALALWAWPETAEIPSPIARASAIRAENDTVVIWILLIATVLWFTPE